MTSRPLKQGSFGTVPIHKVKTVAEPTQASGFIRLLILCVAILILTCLNKFILGTGQNFTDGQIMVQTSKEILFARLSSFIILCLSIVLTAVTGVSNTALKRISLFWLPLIGYLWLRIPILEGDISILFRTLNFCAVITSMSLLACNRRNAALFWTTLYYLMALTNFIGLALYFAKSPFAYFSDGYGIMFTGVFPQKDLLSTTAGLGILFALQRILTKRTLIDIGIFVLQGITLLLASTLSSLGAVIIGAFALFYPLLAIGLGGGLAVLIPLTYSIATPIFKIIGKDETLTGRTKLWQFTLQKAQDSPFFGHGFRHISATHEWMQMLHSEFRNDSFFIPHAHNLWVESFEKFGILGALILIFTLIISPMLNNRNQVCFFLDRFCLALLSFWLFKSALTVPFLNSDTTAYLWAFCFNFSMAWRQPRPLML